MIEFSTLIGGKAGDGINSAGFLVAQLFNRMGYSVYSYFDYPSLIKGGHNFSLVRACAKKTGAHRNHCDFVLALNQDSVDLHPELIGDDTTVVYDSYKVKYPDGIPVDIDTILAGEKAPDVMGNSCIIGAFACAAGIPWETLREVFERHIPKSLDLNLRVARRGYDAASPRNSVPRLPGNPAPLLTGNEAIALGLIRGGMDAYVAYPMTPASNVLHFLAGVQKETGIQVVHPENEIGVILMALGFAYTGKKTAVGTSGGGFCLMTEGFSLAGMSEVPVTVVLGQRTGPSTGLPTYTAQSELFFALHAGQGEFPRLIVAPGDAEQATALSAVAMQISWNCQVPAIILVDKTLCEGTYSYADDMVDIPRLAPPSETVGGPYQRYAPTPSGISPAMFPPSPGAVIKVNGYVHDEDGITTEDADITVRMVEKRERKGLTLEKEVEKLDAVRVSGNPSSPDVLLCWGSNKGVAGEVGDDLGLRVVQPLVLWPFPEAQFRNAIHGSSRIISIEDNSTGQLGILLSRFGIRVDHRILKYDGRPFAVDELAARVKEVVSHG
ncbi:2-oxoglutarate ferredoxin oxidoreductase subunit alpha [Methanolinea mesophila]|uniref:2-oxoacid:acceptor oxidoreductase subunit alpha n=1 Tax=Methanolinea mesophila TaxID=547055 RepID=UPI001AEB1220|nr:2-oxoacid:acceptor oxidoreductase subunit alpha [Methanolinea mesophila]MBP1929582.1 2-oxoglutarate ferredoxin oxidoreductase subunit alpha [Methanolinea mesophila]